MPQLQQLLDRRANVWEQYQERLNAEGDLTAEDRQALDRMEADISDMTSDIERIQRAEGLVPAADDVDRSTVPNPDQRGEPAPDAEGRTRTYDAAFDAFLRRGISGVDAEHRSALEQRFDPETRAQAAGTDSAGGYTVPEGFLGRMTESMLAFGGMLGVVNVVPTTSGNPIVWPSNDDTANKGALLAENTQVAEQDTTFGQKTLDAYMYTSKLVRVSIQLLQDSAFDLDTWLPRKLGERIGRIVNEHLTTGTGSGQPNGVVTAATTGVTGATGQTTSVTYDDIIDLEHSVDAAYRNERARFMFHDLTLAELRKLKDADNRPLWQPSLVAGAPDVFNGRPYTVNNDMPEMAASAKSILFGDFETGYVARRVQGASVMRLTERYADFLQVGFLGFQRWDGDLDDAGAIKAYANSAT